LGSPHGHLVPHHLQVGRVHFPSPELLLSDLVAQYVRHELLHLIIHLLYFIHYKLLILTIAGMRRHLQDGVDPEARPVHKLVLVVVLEGRVLHQVVKVKLAGIYPVLPCFSVQHLLGSQVLTALNHGCPLTVKLRLFIHINGCVSHL
jgi:hypothetical protein